MYQTVVPSSFDASSPASFLELINILSCNDNKSGLSFTLLCWHNLYSRSYKSKLSLWLFLNWEPFLMPHIRVYG